MIVPSKPRFSRLSRLPNSPRQQGGFTLIEGIITIVILGIAMVTLTSFLFPQVERSAAPYYQARAAAIGNAFLNEILSRKFDENTDPFGDSVVRCGETHEGIAYTCSEPNEQGVWPIDKASEYFDYVVPGSSLPAGKGLVVAIANDVDDFHGCWGDLSLCYDRYSDSQFPWRGAIENLTGEEVAEADTYRNMTVKVDIRYDNRFNTADSQNSTYPHQHKRIVVEVDTGRYGKFDFVAYRSNY
ncbi:prepilin-type N-terminal cleavage/methylation domain-containing protein [Photobacterium sp. ZSDE20]|uniref:Prepilin-type N-terminal cleavage/methylation domain-containing protein n=1 Tax=Photobacterium pectinilyticum TaxID=2906793 RepID=A0ABT1MXE1_9GAMM|nr:prepilin-type N-terminal cleavage/methylation domain-containing protein [Photobacterium sp. ZSDE20]MCQ1057133.1 prepilin-type N-terminal cleavage/methylation domain-containing protein [Photobacterium sp. ZSDE20]MDD1821268.1 prepilin-type N-terminal cleavage/methylation domain-containing protein [Photobacterium sp. ZSDE20]